MLESPTTPIIRRAMDRAHVERAAAMRAAWAWLFGARPSR